MSYGEKLKDILLKQGEEIIYAGTVMVFLMSGKKYMMFQMLHNLPLRDARNASFVGYETGSIVFTHSTSKFVPTIRFRDCRMPTKSEFNEYERRETV